MPGTKSIQTDIIVNTSATGVDLIDLKKAIEQNITSAMGASPIATFDITLALAASSNQQYTGVFQAYQKGPDITAPLVLVDIIYNDSPKIAMISDDMETLLYVTVPTTVTNTVVKFITPRVDIGKIQFTRGIYLSLGDKPPPKTPAILPFGHPDLKLRLESLEQQMEQIIPLLKSKL